MFSVLLFCFLDKPPTNYKNLQIYGKKNETLEAFRIINLIIFWLDYN